MPFAVVGKESVVHEYAALVLVATFIPSPVKPKM